MASNSDSVEFEINNQLGMPNTEEDNTPSDPNSVVETQDDRARWPTPTHQEVNLHMLMELISKNNKIINEKFDKQNEDNRISREEIRTQIDENNRLISEKLEKQWETRPTQRRNEATGIGANRADARCV